MRVLTDNATLTIRRAAIATLFQDIWAKTQRALPAGSADRVEPVPVLAYLGQRQLPPAARYANLRTATFVDRWIMDYCWTGRTIDDLVSSGHELRLSLLMFAYWSAVRLAPDGRKRDGLIGSLPPGTAARIAHWRTLSLSTADGATVDNLMRREFIRTPYQETLDGQMIRAAINCHQLSDVELAEIARGCAQRPATYTTIERKNISNQ